MTGDADQTEELSEYKKRYFTSRGLLPADLNLLPRTKRVFDGLSDNVVEKLDELGTALEDDLKHGDGVPPKGDGAPDAEEDYEPDADADPAKKLNSYVFMIH